MATSEAHETTGKRVRWLVTLRAIEAGGGREEWLTLTADGQIEAEREARQLIHRRMAAGERITGWQLVALPVSVGRGEVTT